jgi:hypothetical protein
MPWLSCFCLPAPRTAPEPIWADERGVTNYGEIEGMGALARLLHYYPTSSDSFLTAVTIRGGTIANLEHNGKKN